MDDTDSSPRQRTDWCRNRRWCAARRSIDEVSVGTLEESDVHWTTDSSDGIRWKEICSSTDWFSLGESILSTVANGKTSRDEDFDRSISSRSTRRTRTTAEFPVVWVLHEQISTDDGNRRVSSLCALEGCVVDWKWSIVVSNTNRLSVNFGETFSSVAERSAGVVELLLSNGDSNPMVWPVRRTCACRPARVVALGRTVRRETFRSHWDSKYRLFVDIQCRRHSTVLAVAKDRQHVGDVSLMRLNLRDAVRWSCSVPERIEHVFLLEPWEFAPTTVWAERWSDERIVDPTTVLHRSVIVFRRAEGTRLTAEYLIGEHWNVLWSLQHPEREIIASVKSSNLFEEFFSNEKRKYVRWKEKSHRFF